MAAAGAFKEIWVGAYFNDENQYETTRIRITKLVVDQATKYVQGCGIQKGEIEFSLKGTYDPHTHEIAFQKITNQGSFFFKGSKTDKVIQGFYSDKLGGQQIGQMILQSYKLKPGWNGYYLQNGEEFPMMFEHLDIQRLPGGKVTGNGDDVVGKFTFDGGLDYASSTITFVKQYIGAHKIYYKGTLNGNKIKGYWGFDENDEQDEFLLQTE